MAWNPLLALQSGFSRRPARRLFFCFGVFLLNERTWPAQIAKKLSRITLFVMALGFIQFSSSAKIDRPLVVAYNDAMFGLGPTLSCKFALGHAGFLSSVLWVDAVMDFANNLVGDSKKSITLPLSAKLTMISELDTMWNEPYKFAGLVLEDRFGRPLPANLEILQRGIRRLPENIQLRLIYSQRIQQAYWIDSTRRLDSAVKILKSLAMSQNAPEFARTLALTLQARSVDGLNQSLRDAMFLWRSSDDPLSRYLFKSKVEDLLVRFGAVPSGVAGVITNGLVGIVESKNVPTTVIDSIAGELADSTTRGRAIWLLSRIE